MRNVTEQNLGVVIAYLVPGCVALTGISLHSQTVRSWLGAETQSAPTISGFLYATLASTGLGIFINTLRRLTLDQLHHVTGIRKCEWNYQALQENIVICVSGK